MNILVPIMQGFEEIELVSIIDTLRRADINIIIARDSNNDDEMVIGAHNIIIKSMCKISQVDIDSLDGIALAGGFEGMLNLKNSKEIIEILQELDKQNKLISAICASPIVLAQAGVLKNHFTCYPGCESEIQVATKYTQQATCINENIITANGPASGILFALEIIKKLQGKEKYNKIKSEMLIVES